ncbi:hypothetical protein AMELA_G00179000 [Ameiurus melas]|uniref:Poly [ADP-ribose] polymerase 12 n=1 Tax=Ameiurus melas TaxID=219545 RepID=A0A7J6A9T9_AMEME|nr:hypothetical protein AMELA_G00179000 [Ameiurus melas]
MAEETSVIQIICDQLGCVEYDDLLQLAEVDDLERVIKNSDFFTVIQPRNHPNKSRKILVSANIRRCRTRECQESCTDLHLCKYHLVGQCNAQRCKYGHSLETEHNSRVLRKHSLHDLSKDQLRVLLLLNDSSLLPNVCVSYNKGSGEFGNCPDKEACDRLHVCEKYIRGLCDGSVECNRCHDFFEPHPTKALQAKGVASHLIKSLLLIYRNILTLKDHRYARDKPAVRSKENPQSSSRASVSQSLQSNAVNVICLSFIRGTCKYGDKCWRIHFGVPYKWEVEVDEVWIDLPDNEMIERDYCDPAKIHSVGSEPVCFDTMMHGLHRVRRLSTVSSVIEPSFSHTTKWVWYWENEYNKWIPYGSIKEMHRLSTINSEAVEKKYLQFLENNNQDVFNFYAGKQFYELNFRDMKQRNEMSNTERAVRRRPSFVSLFDVRTARTRRGPNTYTHTGVPGFWDKTAIPDSGFRRVLLSASHKDYIRVQEHFKKTMKDFSILHIERVQNKELWVDFQTKRERMKKANSHKKYLEGERLLFHGTKANNVDAICLQNFDMRVAGANGTVYGQGSYFARDAKYSSDYTDRYGERSMFACRVLVGQYTKGAAHYRRPPAKDAAGNLYDSCVNDMREPTIYVVFDRPQVYPEFLITYEKTSFPGEINIIQSNCTANVSKCNSGFEDVSQTASGINTSSPHKYSITFGSTCTGETLATASIPITGISFFAALDSPVKPEKDVSLDTLRDDTNSLNVAQKSVHSKTTQGLTSLSRLLKESDQALCTSVKIPVFSGSDNLRISVEPSLTDNSIQSGIAKNQQETLTVCASNLSTERMPQRSQQDSQNAARLRSLEFTKPTFGSLDPFSRSSDKAKISDDSPTSSVSSPEMASKTSMPYKTSCSSVHNKSPSHGSLSGPLASFDETRSSEGTSQRFNAFDDVFNVSQTAGVISTSSPREAYITFGSTSTGEEFLTSKTAQGLTSPSNTGLPRKSAQDLLTSVKIPVSSHSDNQLLISGEPSLTDKSIHLAQSKLSPNPVLVTKQKFQSSQQDSQTPAARSAIPSSTATVRTLSSNASSASSHSAQESKISVKFKTSSSSADKQSRSDGSLSGSSVSFYEMQPSAFSSKQTSPEGPKQAPQRKNLLQARSVQKPCVVQ